MNSSARKSLFNDCAWRAMARSGSPRTAKVRHPASGSRHEHSLNELETKWAGKGKEDPPANALRECFGDVDRRAGPGHGLSIGRELVLSVDFGRAKPRLRGSVYCTFTALLRKSLIINGAGEGNRTLISGLGSPHSATEPHPLPLPYALAESARTRNTSFDY